MSKEEAIKWFRSSAFYHKDHEPFNMAIEALQQESCDDATKLAEALIDLRIKGDIKDITFVRKFINDVEIQVKVSVKDTRPCFCGAELEDVSEIYRRMKGKSDGKDDN